MIESAKRYAFSTLIEGFPFGTSLPLRYNSFMSVVPQRDWSYFAERERKAERQLLRSTTPEQRLAIYEEMFGIFRQGRRTMPGDWEKLDQWRWNEKLAARQRMLEAFRKMDQLPRGLGTT